MIAYAGRPGVETIGDDVALIWWDPDAQGADELGRAGPGMDRFANGGQRYTLERPSCHPRIDPRTTRHPTPDIEGASHGNDRR